MHLVLRSRHFALHLLLNLTLLACATPKAKAAGHSKDFPGNNWQNGLASVSANGTLFRAGDTVTVTVTCNSDYWCQALILGVPGAVAAELDGVPVPRAAGAGYYDHLFDANPHPVPHGCYFINYPGGAGTHTASFKLGDDASGKFTKSVSSNGVTQLSGPFVILDRPQYQMWSTLFPIEITGVAREFSLTKTAQTPQPEGVRPEETVTYTLSAKAPATAKEIIIEDELPTGVELVGGLGANGVLNQGRLKWTIPSGGTVSRSYQVKVVKYGDLPRGLKVLETHAKGQTTLESRKKLFAQAQNSVDLILPWTIAGLTKDLQFDFDNSTQVTLKRVTPMVDVELLDAAGEVVDSDVGKASGAFELHARNPGKHRIRGKLRADRFDVASDTVAAGAELTGGAFVEVKQSDPPSKEYKKDIFIPITLNNHYVAQLQKLREFKSVDNNFAGIGYDTQTIQEFLNSTLGTSFEFPGPYNVTKAAELLTKAQANDFIDNQGQPVFFEKLYDGSGEQDGWNAVIRASAFVDMLTLRQVEFTRMSEKAGTAFAKAIALSIVLEKGRRQGEKVQKLIAEKRFSELPPQANVKVEALKIGALGFGIGMALPAVLDKLGYQGAQKAKLIEFLAKITRYGPDLLLRKFLPGKLKDDLIFEGIFQSIRFMTVLGLQDIYTAETQENLDSLASSLALGLYSEDTAAVLDALEREDERVRDRSDYSLDLINRILGATSFVRAADGVLFKLKAPLQGVTENKFFGGAAKGLLGLGSILTDNGSAPIKEVTGGAIVDSKKMSDAVRTPLRTTVLVAGIGSVLEITLWEFVLRDRDMLSAEYIATRGRFSDGSSALTPLPSPGAPARAVGALPADGTLTFVGSPSETARVDADSSMDRYLAALKKVEKAISSRQPGDLSAIPPELTAAHEEFFRPLITLHDRLLPAAPLLDGAQGEETRRFILAVERLLAVVGHAYEAIFVLPLDPNASMTTLARSSLNELAGDLRKFSEVLSLAESLRTLSNLPGALLLREGTSPTDAEVLSGNPFDLEVDVKNVGDTATAAQTVGLAAGTDLVLLSSASVPVPPLQPGESATLTWSVKARAVDPAGQALSYYVCSTGGAGATAQLNGFLLVEPE